MQLLVEFSHDHFCFCVSVVKSVFSCLVLFESFFFFPLVSLAKGLSILFIFSKDQLLVSLVFATVVFISHLFLLWSLCFFFFLLTLGVFCLFVFLSLVALGVRFSCYLSFFLFPEVRLYCHTFLLELLLLHSIGFGWLCFRFHLFLDTLFPPWFLQWFISCLVMYYLASTYLWFSQNVFFLVVLFLIS